MCGTVTARSSESSTPEAEGTVPIGFGDEIAGTDLRGINNRGAAQHHTGHPNEVDVRTRTTPRLFES
jgi:hypothetical protein